MKINIVRFASFSMLALLPALGFVSCNNGSTSETGATEEAQTAATSLPVLTLKEEATYDFGKVKDGEVVEKTFAFQNTGDAPLVISNISASCGCTTPEWPKEPIAPGAESNIVVRFNTAGKPGQQNKTVTVTANTDPSVIELHVKGVVEGK